jgi:molybdopterin converting factor small subunit
MVPEEAIHLTVTFLGLLRDQIGAPRLEFYLPSGSRLEDLLRVLVPEVEGRLGDWAWDSEKHCFTSRVTVARGRSVIDKEGGLVDGEEIIVFPPMAGG